jgi:hypothetical protein
MSVDNNALEKQALDVLRQDDKKTFNELQDRFLAQELASGEDYCSCKTPCKFHGKCRECVMIHRGHGDHLPVCFYGLLNERLGKVAELSESRVQGHG